MNRHHPHHRYTAKQYAYTIQNIHLKMLKQKSVYDRCTYNTHIHSQLIKSYVCRTISIPHNIGTHKDFYNRQNKSIKHVRAEKDLHIMRYGFEYLVFFCQFSEHNILLISKYSIFLLQTKSQHKLPHHSLHSKDEPYHHQHNVRS